MLLYFIFLSSFPTGKTTPATINGALNSNPRPNSLNAKDKYKENSYVRDIKAFSFLPSCPSTTSRSAVGALHLLTISTTTEFGHSDPISFRGKSIQLVNCQLFKNGIRCRPTSKRPQRVKTTQTSPPEAGRHDHQILLHQL
eukprot:TRINITY_DN1974_c0_g1_i2.p1 TRINITY_DN1974_c0_g1~~TRINITY_DN1974_c0_g1_i2.p1  ORF type:complete len:141 (+),score=9.81 TRINITY_DN1974_c0_g1_i2:504-926(+)